MTAQNSVVNMIDAVGFMAFMYSFTIWLPSEFRRFDKMIGIILFWSGICMAVVRMTFVRMTVVLIDC